MTGLRLTHANLKQPTYVVKELVAFFYHSPGHSCTHVVMSGGAIFPAQESTETIARMMGLTMSKEGQND